MFTAGKYKQQFKVKLDNKVSSEIVKRDIPN